MLATFVIGLREGLEAALIVGIIAAFLKRNGKSLAPLWWGVVSATALSALVGVVLMLVEKSLPQAAQEGMETVIGAVAVCFVTGMVIWMGTHSRGLKKELETSAGAALGEGTASALALMAFLAVLKEGFETSVFLLATFQASSNGSASWLGALLGIAVAVGLGYGLYSGGVSLNLGKFFRYTSVFLVLVAAGLVVSAVHTAHEAGWLDAGQQQTVNLSWLAPAGSVRSALFTGVLGIPSRPRRIEVAAWFTYLVPMCLVMFWPARRRPSARVGAVIRVGLAGGCALAAAVLALVVHQPRLSVPATAGLEGGGTVHLDGTTLSTASGQVELHDVGADQRSSIAVRRLVGPVPATHLPTSVSLADLVALAGGRLPIGVSAGVARGPFTASWSQGGHVQAWTRDGGLVDAQSDPALTLTLTGGGLTTPRTLSVAAGARLDDGTVAGQDPWRVDSARVNAIARQEAGLAQRRADATFLGRTLPMALVLAAATLLLAVARGRRATGQAAAGQAAAGATTPTPRTARNESRVLEESAAHAH